MGLTALKLRSARLTRSSRVQPLRQFPLSRKCEREFSARTPATRHYETLTVTLERECAWERPSEYVTLSVQVILISDERSDDVRLHMWREVFFKSCSRWIRRYMEWSWFTWREVWLNVFSKLECHSTQLTRYVRKVISVLQIRSVDITERHKVQRETRGICRNISGSVRTIGGKD